MSNLLKSLIFIILLGNTGNQCKLHQLIKLMYNGKTSVPNTVVQCIYVKTIKCKTQSHLSETTE